MPLCSHYGGDVKLVTIAVLGGILIVLVLCGLIFWSVMVRHEQESGGGRNPVAAFTLALLVLGGLSYALALVTGSDAPLSVAWAALLPAPLAGVVALALGWRGRQPTLTVVAFVASLLPIYVVAAALAWCIIETDGCFS
jgi:hypothetical protein